jgi:hypothetical protein
MTAACCVAFLSCRQPEQQQAVSTASCASPFAKAAAGGVDSSRAVSTVGAAAAANREAKLAAENKDLVEKLAATHQKLKQLRAKSHQREAVQQAQVRASDWPGKCTLHQKGYDTFFCSHPLWMYVQGAGVYSDSAQLSCDLTSFVMTTNRRSVSCVVRLNRCHDAPAGPIRC